VISSLGTDAGQLRVQRRLKPPRTEALFVATLVVFGIFLGAQPIVDNSMLQHLRTGIDIVAGDGIPRRDPYSFTAAGEPWVVQSWLAAAVYGVAHRLAGYAAVVVLTALMTGALTWLVVRLARTGAPRATMLSGAVVMAIGSPFWSPRPLLFGLLGLALTVTVVERGWSPWLLVPVVWVWVNTHG
jgi:hypothetical protein